MVTEQPWSEDRGSSAKSHTTGSLPHRLQGHWECGCPGRQSHEGTANKAVFWANFLQKMTRL